MSNYLKSEVYRITHTRASYAFLLVCSLLMIAFNFLLCVVKISDDAFPYATTEFSFSTIYTNLYIILILCITVSHIIFGSEYQNHTLKNSISFGISRSRILCGKMIIQVLYSLICFLVVIGVYILSAYLFLENSGSLYLEILLKGCLSGIPYYLCALAIGTMTFSLFESTGLAIGVAMLILAVVPVLLSQLAMKYDFFYELSKLMPITNLSDYSFSDDGTFHAAWLNQSGMVRSYFLGFIEAVIFFLISMTGFRRKEIK